MGIKASAQVTVVDITDAYNVILTSEAYTFAGNTSGAPAGLSCVTQAVAYCGGNQCQKVTIGSVTCPTGISFVISNNSTASPTVTFTTTATVSASCEATIPVTVDGVTINKKFSFAVAKEGSGFGWNLAKNTAASKSWSSKSPYANDTWIGSDGGSGWLPKIKIEPNQDYTLSFDYVLENIAANKVGCGIGAGTSGNNFSNDLWIYAAWLSIYGPDGHFVYHMDAKTEAQIGTHLYFAFRPLRRSGSDTLSTPIKITISNFKLEKGSTTTAWTPNPDDLIGEVGPQGPKGDTGSAGRGISSTVTTYQAGASGTTKPTGSWSSSPPATSADKPYLWTKIVVTYTDGTTSESYSVGATPEGITVGGRNLILNSDYCVEITSENTKFLRKNSDINFSNLKAGDTVTFSAYRYYDQDKAEIMDSVPAWANNIHGIYAYMEYLTSDGTKKTVYPFLASNSVSRSNTSFNGRCYSTYTIPNDVATITLFMTQGTFTRKPTDTNTVFKCGYPKLEVGNKPTDWTPAPEDVNSAISDVDKKADTAQSTANTAISKAATLEQNLDGFKTTVSKTYVTGSAYSADKSAMEKSIDSLDQEVGEMYPLINDAQTAADTAQTCVNTLGQRVSTVEQTAEKIQWIVKSDSSASAVTLTDEAIAAITKQLTITGADGSTTIIEGGKIKLDDLSAISGTFSGKVNARSINVSEELYYSTWYDDDLGRNISLANYFEISAKKEALNGNIFLGINTSKFYWKDNSEYYKKPVFENEFGISIESVTANDLEDPTVSIHIGASSKIELMVSNPDYHEGLMLSSAKITLDETGISVDTTCLTISGAASVTLAENTVRASCPIVVLGTGNNLTVGYTVIRYDNAIYFNQGSERIYRSGNDAAGMYGGTLANLVFSSWYGVSFTTTCQSQTYTGKTAVGINCRSGDVSVGGGLSVGGIAAIGGTVSLNSYIYRTAVGNILTAKLASNNNYAIIMTNANGVHFSSGPYDYSYGSTYYSGNTVYMRAQTHLYRNKNWEATSDIRLKHGIRDISDAFLEAYMDIDPVQFIWNDSPDLGRQSGVIAQQVAQALEDHNIDPEAANIVTLSEDVETYGFRAYTVNYDSLHIWTMAVVQKHDKRIKELEDELAKLKANKTI